MFHVVNLTLKLFIKHTAVGDNDDAMKDNFIARIMQICQVVSKPSDGVGFARTRRMLNQIVFARAVVIHISDEFADGVQLR